MTDDRSAFTEARAVGKAKQQAQRLEQVVCKSCRWGAGCGHPVGDHVGPNSAQPECCCCTRRHNDPSHVDTCLDCSIMHGKRQVRLRHGIETPSTADVEPHIPEALKRAFWERYVGKYFDAKEATARPCQPGCEFVAPHPSHPCGQYTRERP